MTKSNIISVEGGSNIAHNHLYWHHKLTKSVIRSSLSMFKVQTLIKITIVTSRKLYLIIIFPIQLKSKWKV